MKDDLLEQQIREAGKFWKCRLPFRDCFSNHIYKKVSDTTKLKICYLYCHLVEDLKVIRMPYEVAVVSGSTDEFVL